MAAQMSLNERKDTFFKNWAYIIERKRLDSPVGGRLRRRRRPLSTDRILSSTSTTATATFSFSSLLLFQSKVIHRFKRTVSTQNWIWAVYMRSRTTLQFIIIIIITITASCTGTHHFRSKISVLMRSSCGPSYSLIYRLFARLIIFPFKTSLLFCLILPFVSSFYFLPFCFPFSCTAHAHEATKGCRSSYTRPLRGWRRHSSSGREPGITSMVHGLRLRVPPFPWFVGFLDEAFEP